MVSLLTELMKAFEKSSLTKTWLSDRFDMRRWVACTTIIIIIITSVIIIIFIIIIIIINMLLLFFFINTYFIS